MTTTILATLLAPLAAAHPDAGDGIDAVDLLVRTDDPHLQTPMGTALLLGGGANAYLTDRARNATGVGGSWLLRGVVGTRSVLAAEVAYVGLVNPIDSRLAFEDSARLLSNGAEVDLRAQIPIALDDGSLIQPFLTAGVGFLGHDVIGTDDPLTTDGGFGDDVTFHLPIGAGIGLARSGFIGDLRVTYRPVLDDASVFGRPTRFDGAIDGLTLNASVGIEI